VILGVRWSAVGLGETRIFIGVVGFWFWGSMGSDTLAKAKW
jgi:hypothetical protein